MFGRSFDTIRAILKLTDLEKIFSLGGLDTTGMPFDSVEAWDVMSDEIIEFQDSAHFLPADAADFTFIEVDDYKVRKDQSTPPIA